MKHYVVCIGVCGREVVAHMKENGPHPNALGLNGPGGSVGADETLGGAAYREWCEEVQGLPSVPLTRWILIKTLLLDGATLSFLAARVPRPEGPFTVDGLPGMLFHPHEDVIVATAEHFVEMARKAVEMLG